MEPEILLRGIRDEICLVKKSSAKMEQLMDAITEHCETPTTNNELYAPNSADGTVNNTSQEHDLKSKIKLDVLLTILKNEIVTIKISAVKIEDMSDNFSKYSMVSENAEISSENIPNLVNSLPQDFDDYYDNTENESGALEEDNYIATSLNEVKLSLENELTEHSSTDDVLSNINQLDVISDIDTLNVGEGDLHNATEKTPGSKHLRRGARGKKKKVPDCKNRSNVKKQKYQCDNCKKYFSSKINLRRHYKKMHSELQDKIDQLTGKLNIDISTISLGKVSAEQEVENGLFSQTGCKMPTATPVCDFCEKTFPCMSAMLTHRRIHTGEKPFCCIECKKSFSSKASLLRHLKTHSEDRPFMCEECGKGFYEKKELNFHRRRHMGDKRYKCKQCERSFYQSNELKTHVRRKHTGEKPFICETCGVSFYDNGKLARHRKIHTGDIQCKECGKTFGQNYHLIAHMRTHTGEKPFVCEECGMCFTAQASVKRHMMIHTGEKPFSCADCGMNFNQNSILQGHIKNRHSGKNRIVDVADNPLVSTVLPAPQE